MVTLSKADIFNKRIREPYNEAWECLQSIRNDNSDAAWLDFTEKLDEFNKRMNKAQSPHEFEYLRHLYHVLLEAGEVVGEIHKNNGSKATEVARDTATDAATK